MTNIGDDIGRALDANLVTRAAKYPAPTAQNGNYNYQSKIPDLSDSSNIQEAIYMYHYGQPNYNPTAEISADSVEGWLGHLQHQIDFNASTISGGGETKTTEPTLTPTGQPIPDGYVWVDKDANANTVLPTYPPAVYSSVQPTGWGMADKGRIWVNESIDNSVLNVNSYQLKNQYTSNAPLSPLVGQIWMNSDNNITYFYNGTIWIEISGSGGIDFLLIGA